MCASSRNVTIPTPPHPNPSHDLRSTDHVCKCKERYHPHPTPPQPHPIPTCVAPTTCASSRNVIIPTPPHPNPMTCVAPTMCASARNMMLRSTDHVCKFKERYHPHPTPPQPHPNFIYINPLGAGVPGEPPAPRVHIFVTQKMVGEMLAIVLPTNRALKKATLAPTSYKRDYNLQPL